MTVRVRSRSATAMLAMNKFVSLMDDFFNTTNKPKELPNRATRKITAYASVMPILISALSCCCVEVESSCPRVMFVPKSENYNFCITLLLYC